MEMFVNLVTYPTAWTARVMLIVMEVVLGIDNLIFISVLTNTLPDEHRPRARRLGIAGALVLRLALLGAVAFILQLTQPIFTVFDHGVSWRDLILIAGGLFLVWMATKEIHEKLDPDPNPNVFGPAKASASFGRVVAQILLLDVVFSLDSIITAVGMTPHLPIIVVAVVTTVMLMLFAAGPLANFINANPTVVMLALGFLLLIGTTLIAEGFGAHIPKGYIYAAMAFSALVEGLNIFARLARQRRMADSEGGA